jgi:hypothetical protein
MLRGILLIAFGCLLVAALGWTACVRQDKVAARGQELLFDDFGFSVRDVRKTKTLGPQGHAATASGTYWIVDLQVANHAKRVAYRLDTHQAAIVDAQGRRFGESPEGRAALRAAGGATEPVAEIGHGESCVTRLVFDVPDDAAGPRLKIRFGDIGSLLDYALLGDWSLELRPSG